MLQLKWEKIINSQFIKEGIYKVCIYLDVFNFIVIKNMKLKNEVLLIKLVKKELGQ